MQSTNESTKIVEISRNQISFFTFLSERVFEILAIDHGVSFKPNKLDIMSKALGYNNYKHLLDRATEADIADLILDRVTIQMCSERLVQALKEDTLNEIDIPGGLFFSYHIEEVFLRSYYSLKPNDLEKVFRNFAGLIDDETYFADSKSFFFTNLCAKYFSGRFDDALLLIKDVNLSTAHPFFLETLVRTVCIVSDAAAVEYLIKSGVKADLTDSETGNSLFKFCLSQSFELSKLAIDQGIDACNKQNMYDIIAAEPEVAIQIMRYLLESGSLRFKEKVLLELVYCHPRILVFVADILSDNQISQLIIEYYKKAKAFHFWYLVDRFPSLAKNSIANLIPDFRMFNERNDLGFIIIANICKRYDLEIDFELYALNMLVRFEDKKKFTNILRMDSMYYEAFCADKAVFKPFLTDNGVLPLFAASCKHQLIDVFIQALKRLGKIELIETIRKKYGGLRELRILNSPDILK